MSYKVNDYAAMIGDRVRVEAFLESMRRTIKPGAVVAELGTGIGFFAVMACRMGARRIYAIEPNEAIQVAREFAAANGCADRIEFIQNVSTKIELPEMVDVIVSDMRGTLPWYGHHIPAIVDARKRLLAAGGIMICQQDMMKVAVVDAPEMYCAHTGLPETDQYQMDWQPVYRVVTNLRGKTRVRPEQIILPAQTGAVLDYAEVVNTNFSTELQWIAERSGTAHGLLLWFDATLAGGVTFSNAPTEPELVYGNTFFPLSQPTALNAGDSVTVSLQANLISDDYVWRWTTIISHQGQVKASFKQSTFFGDSLSLQQLRKKADSYVPRLNEDGLLAQQILSLMNNGQTQGEIAEQLAAQYSRRFKNRQEALTYIAELSEKYSE